MAWAIALQNPPPDATATPRRRPPWWPADETWPPRGRPPGAVFVRAIFRLFAGLALLAAIALGAVVLAYHTAGAVAAVAVFVLAGVLGLMLVLAALAAVGAHRFTRPVNDLVEAAGRIERGDYTARVHVRWGPPVLRHLATAFNTMSARLEADERQRRTLLADISHELRNPLTVLQGDLEAMVDGVYLADDAHLARALEETRVLGRLIADLRTLALAETGTLPLHREPADLCVLIAELAASLETAGNRVGVRVEVGLPDDAPLADIDPVRIHEVLSNLVTNALRYAPSGTAITVRLEIDPSQTRATITVDDEGSGIDPQLQEHLFERFVKSPESRGSGLGLAIARELIQAHGGSIAARSNEAGGTQMRVVLPLEGPVSAG